MFAGTVVSNARLVGVLFLYTSLVPFLSSFFHLIFLSSFHFSESSACFSVDGGF